MNFTILNQIEKILRKVDCESYSLQINFDEHSKVLIEKKPEPKSKQTIGFSIEKENK